MAGEDATSQFNAVHDDNARKMRAQFVIGKVSSQPEPSSKRKDISERLKQPTVGPKGKSILLNPRKWVAVQLKEVQQISPDTKHFKFSLTCDPSKRPSKDTGNKIVCKPPSEESNCIMALPIGKHILCQANISGRDTNRPYTPIRPIGLADEDVRLMR